METSEIAGTVSPVDDAPPPPAAAQPPSEPSGTGITEQMREAGQSLAKVFRNAGLRRLNLAWAGSIIGDWAFAVAVSVYAFVQGGATTVGLLATVRYVGMTLIGLPMSILADRLPRKQVMIAADLIRAVLVFAGAAVVAAGGPALAVYVLVVVTAAWGTAFRPAKSALLPNLVEDPGELTAANVTSSTIESVGFFAGPAIAGFMLAITSIQAVFVLNALTFLWSAALVARVRVPVRQEAGDGGPPAQEEASAGFLKEAAAGFTTILSSRDLRLIMALFVVQTVIAGASAVFGVAIALDLLHTGESGVGFLNATLGIGGIAGGFIALMLAARHKLAFDFGVGVWLWGGPLALVVAWPSIPSAVAAMILIGLGNSVVDINAFTILQRIVPDAVMGRVFGAVESALTAGMAIGALLMPLMISTIGLRAGLGVLAGAVTVLLAVSIPGLRRIDRAMTPPPALSLLGRVPILAPLPAPTLERLARAVVPFRLPAGAFVMREGDPGDRFYVIEAGTVEVTIGGQRVRTLAAGDSFGEIALLRDVPRTAAVRAIDDVALLGLERDDFLSAVTGHGAAMAAAEGVVTRLLGGS